MAEPCTQKLLPPHLILRSYRREDHDACERLEQRANQHQPDDAWYHIPYVGRVLQRLHDGLIQVHLRHPQGFDARATSANDYEILVCQDTTTATVIAVVAVNIRTVVLGSHHHHHRPSGGGGSTSTTTASCCCCKVGWVYDLRVDLDYQRLGIATALSNELQRKCQKKGVVLLYLTVNNNNHKAKRLYDKLGFRHASHRAPATQFLMTHREPLASNEMVVARLGPETATRLIAKYYATVDLSPSTSDEYKRLLSADACQGTFLAVPRSQLPLSCVPLLSQEKELALALDAAIRRGDITSYGGISLWNDSAIKCVSVARLVFSKETWLSLPFQTSLLAVFMVPLAMWGSSLLTRVISACRESDSSGAVTESPSSWSYWETGRFAGEAFGLFFASKLLMFGARCIRYITTCDSLHFSARAFAPFRHGPAGVECLRSACLASRAYAKSTKQSCLWILNIAANHPDAAAFPRPGFRTQFLQKMLDPNAPEPWPEFSPMAFSDPRDL